MIHERVNVVSFAVIVSVSDLLPPTTGPLPAVTCPHINIRAAAHLRKSFTKSGSFSVTEYWQCSRSL